jgi:hypothetical protein
MKKKTLVCIHVMPSEIEMFERFMEQYRKALSYCREYDVTIKATLNLNPKLTDWENSELKQDYFMNIFNSQFQYKELKNINQIVLDESMWGTTQQKRESIKIDYFDQFIFCDTDIVMHEHQLIYQLQAAEQLEGMYILSPSLPKWWDESWDGLVSDSMKNAEAFSEETILGAFTQTPTNMQLKKLPYIKFGCGMHTLYSKLFWQFVGIPESFGGYGPEDTYGMTAGRIALEAGYIVNQYVLDGLYITEDYINRVPSFDGKIKPIDKKSEFYKNAEQVGRDELIAFVERLKQKVSVNH